VTVLQAEVSLRQRVQTKLRTGRKAKSVALIVAILAFASCIAPTFISYAPYVFTFDDADYMWRSIAVSHAVRASDQHGIARLREVIAAMYSLRPPVMTLMGLPWLPQASWHAVGNSLFTLAAVISFVAAFCLFLLLRIGVKPVFLGIASVCVLAALGPFPVGSVTNNPATGFMADSLFAWITLAALLLIPYEARVHSPSIRGAFVRGLLWGIVLSPGVMTKISFLYFVMLIGSTLFIIRQRHSGFRNSCVAFLGFVVSSAPATAYLVKFGGWSFANGKTQSFGQAADIYHVSVIPFLSDTFSHAPGLMLFPAFVLITLTYLIIKKRSSLKEPASLAFLIALIYGVIVLVSANRQIRYAFPTIIALYFLLAILLSGKQASVSQKAATLAAGMVFCVLVLVGLPVRHRAQRQASLARTDAILAQATRCDDTRILLMTDSPTLSESMLRLTREVTSSAQPIQIRSVVYNATSGIPIDEDFRQMRAADLIVFQDDDDLGSLMNLRARIPEYRQYVSKLGGDAPVRVYKDVTAYSKPCGRIDR
jgi:hypothetical protein